VWRRRSPAARKATGPGETALVGLGLSRCAKVASHVTGVPRAEPEAGIRRTRPLPRPQRSCRRPGLTRCTTGISHGPPARNQSSELSVRPSLTTQGRHPGLRGGAENRRPHPAVSHVTGCPVCLRLSSVQLTCLRRGAGAARLAAAPGRRTWCMLPSLVDLNHCPPPRGGPPGDIDLASRPASATSHGYVSGVPGASDQGLPVSTSDAGTASRLSPGIPPRSQPSASTGAPAASARPPPGTRRAPR